MSASGRILPDDELVRRQFGRWRHTAPALTDLAQPFSQAERQTTHRLLARPPEVWMPPHTLRRAGAPCASLGYLSQHAPCHRHCAPVVTAEGWPALGSSWPTRGAVPEMQDDAPSCLDLLWRGFQAAEPVQNFRAFAGLVGESVGCWHAAILKRDVSVCTHFQSALRALRTSAPWRIWSRVRATGFGRLQSKLRRSWRAHWARVACVRSNHASEPPALSRIARQA
ncbi:hypothetical protein J2W96_006558 [Variovorax guangxiensis]|nr:hypothetical protein [Variovorax guangxiensis]